MKLNKLLLCILFLALVFSCVSCGFFGDQEYVCDISMVESIEIIRLDKYVEGEYRYEYTVLSSVVDHATFVKRLNELEQSVNWGEPSTLNIGCVVIRIDYLNGDYDMLYTNAQWFNRSGVNQDGYFFFNEVQFDALVSDYLCS